MTDFEVCPIGTAARIVELEAAIDSIETSHGLTSGGNLWRFWSKKSVEVSENNKELRAALEQSRAETAAAYERAVEVLDMEAEDLKSDASRFRSGTDPHHYRMNFASAAIRQAKAIRALAKPDQTAAMDEVKAAAREQGMREAAAIAEKQKEIFLSPEYAGRFPTNSFAERFACTEVSNAILAAIPKGGE